MRESVAMLEIRKIKDENSLRYHKMSPEELAKKFDDATKRIIKRMGRDINVVSHETARR